MKRSYTLSYIPLLACLTLMLFPDATFSADFPTLVINEIMSSNSVVPDEDGDFPDWIELYNPGEVTVDLTGWGLSDRADNLHKWTFPSYSIAPGEYALVYASGKDRGTTPNHWETVILPGDEWRYFVGVTEPHEKWRYGDFDDSEWPVGVGGFGYGDGDDETVLPHTTSFYLRKSFSIEEGTTVIRGILQIDFDDGFVAYLNGQEFARSNVELMGHKPSYYNTARSDREAHMYDGGNPDVFVISDIESMLVTGENVLAIQIHNSSNSSSDMTAIPYLTLGMDASPTDSRGVPDILNFSLAPFKPHTNFKINKSGETIVLTNVAGAVVDSVSVLDTPSDYSQGTIADDPSEWVIFSAATPGALNSAQGSREFAGTVSPSLSGGFYSAGIDVALSADAAAAEIRYTLDGTMPDETSLLYVSAIHLPDSAVLKARASQTGFLPGAVYTGTYIIGAGTSDAVLPELFITCDESDLDRIYASPYEDIYIAATATQAGKHWPDIRMRIRGDGARDFPKKSYKLKFDSEPYITGRSTINLNAEYFDISYMSQYVSSLLMRASGQPCFDSSYIRVYINGAFNGLYLAVENMDEEFLDASGLDPDGNLYKATYMGASLSIYDDVDLLWEKRTNDESDFSDLSELIDTMNAVPDDEYYGYVQEHFDYDKMVNVIAMNMLLSNGSTYYHNYYMYHDIHGTGKWTMIPWDMDKTLSNTYGSNYSYQRSSSARRHDNPFHERALLTDEIFADIRARVDVLSETIVNEAHISPVLDSLKTVLASSVYEDYRDNTMSTAWSSRIESHKSFLRDRHPRLISQFDNWPRSFSIKRQPEIINDTLTFSWDASQDPNGDDITYTLIYGKSWEYLSGLTTTISGITDTAYVLSELPMDGIYYWYVTASDGTYTIEGFETNNIFEIDKAMVTPVNVSNSGDSAPKPFSLGQNYPNPFNPLTSIPFRLPEAVHVEITVYSVLGQQVATLLDSYMEQGNHSVQFNANGFSSGLYVYSIKAGNFHKTRSMLLLK